MAYRGGRLQKSDESIILAGTGTNCFRVRFDLGKIVSNHLWSNPYGHSDWNKDYSNYLSIMKVCLSASDSQLSENLIGRYGSTAPIRVLDFFFILNACFRLRRSFQSFLYLAIIWNEAQRPWLLLWHQHVLVTGYIWPHWSCAPPCQTARRLSQNSCAWTCT